MMRRLFGAMGLVGVLLVAAPTADAATRLTKIQRPGADQVVGTGKSVRVVVRSRASLDALTITVDGRNVTRSFRRSDGAYRATLRPGQLHAGENQLTVKTRNYKDFDHRTFLVARRVPNLLKLTDLDVAGPSAPVRAEVRVRRDAELDAWVNGRRVDHAFQPAGRSYVGRLGANDGVRPGRNRLVVLVSREVRSGRRAVHDVEERTFRLRPRQVVAGAGRDQVVDAGDPIELRGRAAGADGDVAYGWEIVDAPEGGDGTAIRDADTATPVFVPTAPGVYRLRATVRAARDASAGRVAQVTSSSDTMTVFARTDLPPIGWPLAVGTDNRGTIALDGKPVPDTTKCADPAQPRCALPFITYAVLERWSLKVKESGTLYYDSPTDDIADLTAIAKRNSVAPGYLMVVSSSISTPDNANWAGLMDALGVANSSAARDRANGGPVSIVGVPGAPLGSAYVAAPFCGRGCRGLPAATARINAYLRLNPRGVNGGHFELVHADQVEYNTALEAPTGQVKMKVGSQTFTGTTPTDGSSGFFLVTLSSRLLVPVSQEVFVTNNAEGGQFVFEAERLGNALAAAVQGDERSRGSLLVLLQAFGTPKSSGGWFAGKQAIEAMGGNGQVFAQMNRFMPDSSDLGRYAFVGRTAMDVPPVEASESLGKLSNNGTSRGLLARMRDEQYSPLISGPGGPAGSINVDLVTTLNQPTPAGRNYPVSSDGENSAREFLGRETMGVCHSDVSVPCDVRREYYDNLDADWRTILTDLTVPDICPASAPAPYVFSKEDCNKVRVQLVTEVSARNKIANHFAKLQKPFGAGTQVKALVEIATIAAQIEKDVQPPKADDAAARTLDIISQVVKLAGMAGSKIDPAVGTVANGVAGALGAAAYLTDDKGTPDLIGPEVRDRATQLGAEIAKRLDTASTYFTTEARIILSDWSKMQYVARRADGDWKLEKLETSTTQLEQATEHSLYQALVPVAFPVLYDLGWGSITRKSGCAGATTTSSSTSTSSRTPGRAPRSSGRWAPRSM